MAFRRRRPSAPDPLAVVEPGSLPARYAPPVADALQRRAQYEEIVAALQQGPLRDRLREMSARVDEGVLAVWRTAQRAVELERVIATLDPDRVTAELKQARRAGAGRDVLEALTARFASTQRLLDALDQLRDRLPVLEAQLGTAVARVAELALVPSTGVSALDAVDDELTSLVTELDALRLASVELGRGT